MRWPLLAAVALSGCAVSDETRFDPFVLMSRGEVPAYLGNETTGIRLARDGVNSEKRFKVLGGRITRVNDVLAVIRINNKGVAVTNPAVAVNMHTGEVTTTWHDADSGTRFVAYGVVDPVHDVFARRLTVHGAGQIEIQFVRENRSDFNLSAIYAPDWIKVGETYQHQGGDATIEWATGEEVEFRYAYVRSRSQQKLSDDWQVDIEIDGPLEDQQAIRSFLFYLRMSATPMLPPMAASSELYHGRRFWDAEAWMLPVYALIQPDIAKRATQWRLEATQRNGRVPWEADELGRDVTPAPFRNAIHVAGWTFWWLDRATALGLCDSSEAKKVRLLCAKQLREASTVTERGREILGVISPDEGRKRNNDLVTNLLARRAMQFEAESGAEPPSVRDMVIPRGPDGLPATYDNDALRAYQQTAALLALYPLEEPFDERTTAAMFDRYKLLTSANGPAMSDSIHAVIAARLGRADEAYRFWLKSWRPFLRGPHLFAEKRKFGETYFMTGAAGSLQSVLFGFLGLRILKSAGDPGAPSKKLLNGHWLTIRPCLPTAWRGVTFRNVQILGESFTIHATHDTASIQKER